MKKCSTPSCENTAHACGLCPACYDYIYRAMKRGVRWMVHRRSRIQVWQERLDAVSSKSGVIHIKRKRAA